MKEDTLMKKFLSLVLALVMTFSLVTISAGATEYKDLTDKSTITYSEAVAVLNKLGVITGYEDGSFQPTGSLTRGAAAKIIVSMMIGADAASSLTASTAPYKDVPVDNTFAAYISYCKTAGYISGYSDGTFRPAGTLTGYAFAKMLLGALGYKSSVEGFTGDGWTMNVAKVGNTAGIYNGISSFSGNTSVTREVACQMALNTLKATEVEYAGNDVSVTTGSATVVVGNTKATPVTSTNSDYNANIDSLAEYNNVLTVQFAEEHFKDLKIVKGEHDSFQRPATQWNYKNVKIGKYAKTPIFTFTSSITGDTLADKVRNMGISGYTITPTSYYVNGHAETLADANASTVALEDLASLCGKGDTVLLYNTSTTANCITDIVVIRTQLMQINKINTSAKTVTLKKIDTVSDINTTVTMNTVTSDNDNYATLAAMKADDYVLVTPVATATDATTYDVDTVAVPTVVTGKLTAVTLNSGNTATTGVTVAGTAYSTAKYSCTTLSANVVTVTPNTTTDTTVYTDSFGFIKYIKNVDAATSYAVLADKYTSLVDGKLVTMFTAVTTAGKSITLNAGAGTDGSSLTVPAVVSYTAATSADSAKGAEYTIATAAATTSLTTEGTIALTAGTKINSYDGRLNAIVASAAASAVQTAIYDSNVNFVYLKNTDGVYSVSTVKTGVQTVSSIPAGSMAIFTKVNSNWRVSSVFILAEDNDATGTDVAYVSAKTGSGSVGSKAADVYTLYIAGVETKNITSTNTGLSGHFVTYTVNSDGTYTLKDYTKSDSTTSIQTSTLLTAIDSKLIKVGALGSSIELNATGATVINLTDDNSISSLSDLTAGKAVVSIVYNGNSSSSSYKTVSYIFVNSVSSDALYTVTPVSVTTATKGLTATVTANKAYAKNGDTVTVTVKVTGTATAATPGKLIYVDAKDVTGSASVVATTGVAAHGTTGIAITDATNLTAGYTFTYTYTMGVSASAPTVDITEQA